MMRSTNSGGDYAQVNFPTLKKNQIGLGIVGLLALILVFTSFFQIETYEVGVITRFGRFVRIAPAGLHWKIPFGIEALHKVVTEQVFKQEFGFQTVRSGVQSEFRASKSSEESRFLTGDLNIAVVEWVIHYKKTDPVKFLFNVRNVDATIRDVSEAVMRLVVGNGSIDEVITKNRQEISIQAREKMQVILDIYNTGIRVQNVELTAVNPPDPVKPSFNAVNTAKQDMQKMENEAWETYNKIIPKASGEAQKTIQQAEGYRLNRLNRAKGDAARFISVWREYSQAKDVTRRRLYLETLVDVLSQIDKKFIVDESQKGWLPLMRTEEMKGGRK
ncbi:FtsH protease activity modulator HflK [bacterium]|nr:FtsH protease activity modulator HflK [bacterium]